MTSNAAPDLEIHLFGPFAVSISGAPVRRLRTRKGQWLLAILLLKHNRSIERSWLAGVLWPESDEAKALFNLRHCLNDLRHKLGSYAGCIESPTKHTLKLTLPPSAWCDVDLFDAAMERGDTASIKLAIDMYRGPLLEGCLEEWCIPERELRELIYLDALDQAAGFALEANEPQAALNMMRLSVGINPLRETSQKILMSALAASGDYSGVVEAYRKYRLILRRDLDLDPSAETKQLYQRLRDEASQSERSVVHSRAEARSESITASLPRPPAALIGRKTEIDEISAQIRNRRLISLIGSGGVGKTRLAIEIALEVLGDPFTYAWFVDLAPLSEPSQVESAIGLALHCQQTPVESLSSAIHSFLRGKRSLLVLDNCEHLAAECARITDSLLQASPDLTILVTSREPLRIPDECLHRVPSLSIPEYSLLQSDGDALPSALMEFDAVKLFVERASRQHPDFVLNRSNMEAVVRICRRVDGIPLAIELAAARVRSLTVEQIAERLEETFDLLSGGMRTALPRHQTLKALIEWSFALLSKHEQMLLWRLTVFAGAWSLEDAECVCAGDGIEGCQIVDLVASLVDKSLISFDPGSALWAYRLLDTTRSYARSLLSNFGDATIWKDLHAAHYYRLAKEWNTRAVGPDHAARLDRPERAYHNVRAAMVWLNGACAGTEDERDLELAAALEEFWYYRAYLAEGLYWLERCLAAHSARTAARASALLGLARLISSWKDLKRVTLLIEEALSIFEEKSDLRGMARAFGLLGMAMEVANDKVRSLAAFERALSLQARCGDAAGEIDILKLIGLHHINHRNWDAARAHLENGLALARRLEDPLLCSGPLNNLGLVAYSQGDYKLAYQYHEECLRLNRLTENRSGIAWSLANLGETALAMNDIATAANLHRESLEAFVEIDHHEGISEAVRGLAMVAAARATSRERAAAAAHLLGAWESVSVELGTPVPPYNAEEHEGFAARVSAVLGCDEFERIRSTGRSLRMRQAIEYALSTRELILDD